MSITMKWIRSICLALVVWGVPSVWTSYPIPDEQLLYEDLMRNYQKSVRPVINASNTLIVKFALRLNQIVGLDERQQVLTSNVFIDQEWLDENLAWSPANYNDIRSLRVAGSNVWLPDTFIFNNADDGSTGFMSGTFVQIHNDGSVTWPVPVKLKSSCKVDITYFPFDDQKCILRFGSWIYSGSWVDYVTMYNNSPIDMAYYVNNSEWELLSVTLKKNNRQYECCADAHPDLTFILHIRRKTFYYIFNIIVPCIMLSILTLLTFWLPPTSGEKVTLGLNVFLAFSMFMLLVAEEVPATSEAVPLIGIYLCLVMTMTSVSVIMAVIVINVYNRGMKMRRAPGWMRTLALNWLSKVLRLKHDIELVARHVVLEDHFYEVTKRPDNTSQIRKTFSKFDISKPINSPIFTRHNNNSEGYQPIRTHARNRRNSIGEHPDQWHDPYHRQDDQEPVHNGPPAASFSEDTPPRNIVPSILIESPNASQEPAVIIPNQNACSLQTVLHQNTNAYQSQVIFQHAPASPSGQSTRFEEAADGDSDSDSANSIPHLKKVIVAEWQRIAVVVDRFLFWFYMFVTFTSYLIILIIVPAQHYTHGKRGIYQEGGFQPPDMEDVEG
ncbi:neuronal acetylcholine receptor subunit alpha-10-like [Haliotis rubra]|uniref:neuronal acetylcholine receptor subunit alpha-10-like n=1 Tax=Haliotis rubra TaxID=36100 RepID=UPI001EE5F945|nr:neuronal acetylcholine receptor subunit alpha-10-like [Haliotis rubra]